MVTLIIILHPRNPSLIHYSRRGSTYPSHGNIFSEFVRGHGEDGTLLRPSSVEILSPVREWSVVQTTAELGPEGSEDLHSLFRDNKYLMCRIPSKRHRPTCLILWKILFKKKRTGSMDFTYKSKS